MVIGIACDLDASRRAALEPGYAEAVREAGGEPRALERGDALDGREVRGLLLCGGPFDIPPAWYGQEPRGRIDPPRPERSRLERELLERAEGSGLPVLGICGGAQLMCVHRGGTLVQDIASERPGALDHERGADKRRAVHDVELAGGSRLAALLAATRLAVNSTHHQCVDRPGRGVEVVGRAPDGVAEALEDARLPFWIGVQWHPETLLDAPSRALFRAFVRAAREA